MGAGRFRSRPLRWCCCSFSGFNLVAGNILNNLISPLVSLGLVDLANAIMYQLNSLQLNRYRRIRVIDNRTDLLLQFLITVLGRHRQRRTDTPHTHCSQSPLFSTLQVCLASSSIAQFDTQILFGLNIQITANGCLRARLKQAFAGSFPTQAFQRINCSIHQWPDLGRVFQHIGQGPDCCLAALLRHDLAEHAKHSIQFFKYRFCCATQASLQPGIAVTQYTLFLISQWPLQLLLGPLDRFLTLPFIFAIGRYPGEHWIPPSAHSYQSGDVGRRLLGTRQNFAGGAFAKLLVHAVDLVHLILLAFDKGHFLADRTLCQLLGQHRLGGVDPQALGSQPLAPQTGCY